MPGSHFSHPPASPGANRSIPSDAIHADVPGCSTITAVTDAEAVDPREPQNPGADRDEVVDDGDRRPFLDAGAGSPGGHDQGPAVGPLRDDDRTARPFPLAPEDDTRRLDPERPETSWRPALSTTAPLRPEASGGIAETRSIAA